MIRFSEFAFRNKVMILIAFVFCIITVVWVLLRRFMIWMPRDIFNFAPAIFLGIAIICAIIALLSEVYLNKL